MTLRPGAIGTNSIYFKLWKTKLSLSVKQNIAFEKNTKNKKIMVESLIAEKSTVDLIFNTMNTVEIWTN